MSHTRKSQVIAVLRQCLLTFVTHWRYTIIMVTAGRGAMGERQYSSRVLASLGGGGGDGARPGWAAYAKRKILFRKCWRRR